MRTLLKQICFRDSGLNPTRGPQLFHKNPPKKSHKKDFSETNLFQKFLVRFWGLPGKSLLVFLVALVVNLGSLSLEICVLYLFCTRPFRPALTLTNRIIKTCLNTNDPSSRPHPERTYRADQNKTNQK